MKIRLNKKAVVKEQLLFFFDYDRIYTIKEKEEARRACKTEKNIFVTLALLLI